jgi:hypothetical protein
MEMPNAGADHSPGIATLSHTRLAAVRTAPVEPGRKNVLHRLGSRFRSLTASGLPDKFVSRAAWGARAPKARHTNITPSRGGTALHYEGPDLGAKGPAVWSHADCAGMVRGIQKFHMDTRGWDDIAYTAVVCPHGYVFEGRGVGQRTAAQGTNLGNQNYYALCGLWGEGDSFTDAAKVGYDQGIQWLRRKGAGTDVQPHQHFHSTSCPGSAVMAWLKAGRPLPAQPKPPTPKPKPTPTPTPAPKPTPPPPFPLPKGSYFGPRSGPKNSISGYYSHSADYRRFQVRLQQLGYKIAADGHYDVGRDDAIIDAFQYHHHLVRDKHVGPETWAAAWAKK